MKEQAIKKYLQEQVEFKDIATLHNMFCEGQGLTEFLIYSFVDDIDKFLFMDYRKMGLAGSFDTSGFLASLSTIVSFLLFVINLKD